jgi:hypothetical protein
MGGYVTLPTGAGREWVGRALAHVAALPAKKPKPAKKKA